MICGLSEYKFDFDSMKCHIALKRHHKNGEIDGATSRTSYWNVGDGSHSRLRRSDSWLSSNNDIETSANVSAYGKDVG